jgi:hypothetical protein
MTQTTEQDIIDNVPHEALLFDDGTLLRDVVDALAAMLADHSERQQTAKEGFFIDTASGADLDRLARAVGVDRPTGADDETLRTLTRAAYARATSDTTAQDFGTVVQLTLDTVPNTFTVTAPADTPGVIVTVDSTVIDQAPVTLSELASELSAAVPAGHFVSAETTGTFRFDGTSASPFTSRGTDTGFGTVGSSDGGTLGNATIE